MANRSSDTGQAVERSAVRGVNRSDSEAATFLSLLEGQAAIYDRLSGLVTRQRALIAAEDPSRLLAVLGERQSVTRELSASAERLGAIQERWEELRARMTDDQRSRARDFLRRIEERLREITAADGEDARRLAVRKQRVAETLRSLAPRGAMLSAYGAPRASSTGVLNRMEGGG